MAGSSRLFSDVASGSKLEETADSAIDIIAKAQQADGYLDTYYILTDLSKRFTNVMDNHELYCLGHM